MLAKLTTKNQLTLPKAITGQFSGVEYFEIATDGASITLWPLRPSRANEVRAKLDRLGIAELDVVDAVGWARNTQ